MNVLRKIPFFLPLLALFFCLHGSVENYGFIRFTEVLYPGLYILAGIVLLTAITRLFTKNLLHAALIVFFIGSWYIFFGALHDWVKSTAILSFIRSYPAMLTTLLAVTLAWILLLKYKKNLHGKLALYINSLLLIYCLLDIFLLLKMQLTRPADKPVNQVAFDTRAVAQRPDMYLLLFDGYPGTASLQDSFHFSNDSLQQYFTTHAFKQLPVFANYDLTYFCMSSLFNMQYVKQDYNSLHLTQRDFQKRGVEINNGAIFPLFRSMGYQVSNCSIFEIDRQPPLSDLNAFLLAHSILLTDKMLHNRLKRDMGSSLAKLIPFWKNNDFYQHDTDNKLAEKLLVQKAAEKTAAPQFVYAHFMMPHGPYYYDSLGNKNAFEKILNYSKWEDKELFISYLKYVNRRMMAMVDSIIQNKPGAIVLVMGDHGFRSYRSTSLNQPFRFDNLCMLRMPAGREVHMKDRWSMVNLFPYIFNAGFNQNLPYLADSSITLRY